MREQIRKPALIASLCALTGCVTDGRLPGSQVLTVATAGDVVLVGYSKSLGTVGTFELTSIHGRSMACQGTFRYGPPPRGTARFTCTNGESGMVRIEAGSGLSGEGSGQSSLGPIHLVYGYSLDEVNARMQFPGGKALVQDERGIGFASDQAQ